MTDADREPLAELLLERSVRRGDFVLASGRALHLLHRLPPDHDVAPRGSR